MVLCFRPWEVPGRSRDCRDSAGGVGGLRKEIWGPGKHWMLPAIHREARERGDKPRVPVISQGRGKLDAGCVLWCRRGTEYTLLTPATTIKTAASLIISLQTPPPSLRELIPYPQQYDNLNKWTHRDSAASIHSPPHTPYEKNYISPARHCDVMRTQN